MSTILRLPIALKRTVGRSGATQMEELLRTENLQLVIGSDWNPTG